MQQESNGPSGRSSPATGARNSEPARPGGGTPSGAPPDPNRRETGASNPGVVEQAQQTATDIADQAKQTVAHVAGQAREQVRSRADAQLDRAAQGLDAMAQALRQTGQQLREQNQNGLAPQAVDVAADQVERLASYLHSHDVGQLVSQVEDVARRQPALFLGGAFALGLLGARFLKSSVPRRSGPYDHEWVPRGYRPAGHAEGPSRGLGSGRGD